jgi:deazaflavin-dependent oxidoreductase (nitroreductase family)
MGMTILLLIGTILIVPILLVRFCKRRLAAFHRAVTNRVAVQFAGRLPGFAIVTNYGRRSGRRYETPVNVFRGNDGFLIALTYGRESGWVANVLKAGGCHLETRGISYRLSTPVIVHDPSRRRFPLIVRVVLRLIGATDYLQLHFCDDCRSSSQVQAVSV